MAGQQHIGHRPPLPLGGSCVVRIFKQSGGETFLFRALGRAHDARQQPHDTVQHDLRRQFAARQHVVADADLLHRSGIYDALVYAFVAPAQQDHSWLRGKAPRIVLSEPPSPRGKAHHRPVIRHRGHSRVDDIRPQHHPCPAAERRVVHGAVPVLGKVADIGDVQRPDAGFQCPPRQRLAQRTREHGRKQRQDGGAPSHAAASSAVGSTMISSGIATTIRPAAISTLGTQALVNGRISWDAPFRSISRLAPAP